MDVRATMATRRAPRAAAASATPQRTPNAERLVDATERIWLEDGDLALNVRRLLKEARVTKRDLYLSFQSRDGLLEQVAVGLADHVQEWAAVPTGEVCLRAALERPAAWRALILGHGPEGRPAGPDRFSPVRARLRDAVGGDIELAKLDGVISAVVTGRLDPTMVSRLATDQAEA